MVKIYNAADVLEADRIVFILKENGIPNAEIIPHVLKNDAAINNFRRNPFFSIHDGILRFRKKQNQRQSQ